MLGSFDDVRSDDLTARGRDRVRQMRAADVRPRIEGSSAYRRLSHDCARMPSGFDSLPGLG